MQPQQPPQLSSSPMPSDYLDQIASPQKTPRFSNTVVFTFIGGVLVLVIAFVILIMSMSAPKTSTTERLALRLQTLETVSQDAHSKIKSSQLRSINSTLRTSLINANRDIVKPLTAAKIDLEKADKKLVTEESGEKLTAALEEARLNSTYDRTYALEMAYLLERTTILMDSLLVSTKSSSLKTFLQASIKDFKTLQTQFSTYSSADS